MTPTLEPKTMKENHIALYFELDKAYSEADKTNKAFKSISFGSQDSDVLATFHAAKKARVEMEDLQKKFNKIRDRYKIQNWVANIEGIYHSRLSSLDSFSGSKHQEIQFSSSGLSSAWTVTSKGSHYPGGQYRKTDATHNISVTYKDVSEMYEYRDIFFESKKDGLILVSIQEIHGGELKTIFPKGVAGNRVFRARWIKGNKKISVASGYIAARGSGDRITMFHSETSAKAAQKGLIEKVESAKRLKRMEESAKTGRGVFYKEKEIALKDVRKFTNWCQAGCQQWIYTYLPEYSSKTKAPTWRVGQAAQKAAANGCSYGRRLISLIGIPEKSFIYQANAGFSLWTN